MIRSGNVELVKKAPEFVFKKTSHGKYISLDIDVSLFDNSGSNKEGVSWTYKNHDAYARFALYRLQESPAFRVNILKFGRHCPWFDVFRQLHIKFC